MKCSLKKDDLAMSTFYKHANNYIFHRNLDFGAVAVTVAVAVVLVVVIMALTVAVRVGGGSGSPGDCQEEKLRYISRGRAA